MMGLFALKSILPLRLYFLVSKVPVSIFLSVFLLGDFIVFILVAMEICVESYSVNYPVMDLIRR